MGLTKPKITQVSNPNQLKRRIVTLAKSVFRIGACVCLALYQIELAAALFALGELLAVAQELL